ncbi:MAG: dTMP kinase [Chloroflexota bacterium]|nr:dTMP kinase [Chloroflexota bacterium]MDP9469211.1 dTMP kinase [Chloroflexota bacterium]
MTGFFIALEGSEGAGKSTQARLLAEWLEAAGHSVLLTREPGGTDVGEQVRHVLLAPGAYAILPETETLLYAAARAQHVREVLLPALAAGSVVVCDRYVDSTLAYQGGGRGLPLTALLQVQEFATGGLLPDLRLLLDLPVNVGLARRLAGPDAVNHLDRAGVAFHERVRSAYLDLIAADPAGWAVVDADGPPEVVGKRVVEVVAERLPMSPRADSDGLTRDDRATVVETR